MKLNQNPNHDIIFWRQDFKAVSDSSRCRDTADRCQHWQSLPVFNTFSAPREHISHRNHILEVWVRVRGLMGRWGGRLLISAMACAADPSTLTPLQGGTEEPCVSVCPSQTGAALFFGGRRSLPRPVTLLWECQRSYFFFFFFFEHMRNLVGFSKVHKSLWVSLILYGCSHSLWLLIMIDSMSSQNALWLF